MKDILKLLLFVSVVSAGTSEAQTYYTPGCFVEFSNTLVCADELGVIFQCTGDLNVDVANYGLAVGSLCGAAYQLGLEKAVCEDALITLGDQYNSLASQYDLLLSDYNLCVDDFNSNLLVIEDLEKKLAKQKKKIRKLKKKLKGK